MRASRLLRILLLLQNRGRMTSAQLAEELEVARRTILRDVDSLTEAGLPVIVHQGAQGGVELGFNYRTRLTGLAADEAEALAVLLNRPLGDLADLGVADAARRARTKLIESLPDPVRRRMETVSRQIRFATEDAAGADPRVAALAAAIRDGVVVRLRARSRAPREVHPTALIATAQGWRLVDARDEDATIPLADWGDLNISARRFADAAQSTP